MRRNYDSSRDEIGFIKAIKKAKSSSYLDMAGNVAIPAAAEFCMNITKRDEESSWVHHTKSTLGTKMPPFVVKVSGTEKIVVGGILGDRLFRNNISPDLRLLVFAYMLGGQQYWFGRCICGTEKIFRLGHLKSASTKSCRLFESRACTRKDINKLGQSLKPTVKVLQNARVYLLGAYQGTLKDKSSVPLLRWPGDLTGPRLAKIATLLFSGDMGRRLLMNVALSTGSTTVGLTPRTNRKWSTPKEQANIMRRPRGIGKCPT